MRNLVPMAQFCLFSNICLSLGKDKRAVGTSKLALSHEEPGLREDILGAGC